MAFAQAARRPIEGAVATLGVSDRVAFLRRTYSLLGGALILWAVLTGAVMKFATDFSWSFSKWALQGRWTWLAVIALFMVVGWIATKLAQSETSRGMQFFGLGLEVFAWSMLLQPVIWILMIYFGGDKAAQLAAIQTTGHPLVDMSGDAGTILFQAIGITLAIFIGLTAVVFVTKKDFSFLRGILSICTFAVLGVIVVSMLFGFSLGAIFCGAVILLMAGYILFQTSLVMKEFPPTAYVAAALMLFSTVATLFWYVLQFLMSMRRD